MRHPELVSGSLCHEKKVKEILNSLNSGETRQSTFQNDRGYGAILRLLKFTPSPNLGEGRGEVKFRRFFASLRMTGKKKYAFTLAEVLITLGIIGVVAAMTLPALIQRQNEKATVTALKKFYSTISQAYVYAKNEYGTPNFWYDDVKDIDDPQASNTMVDIFTKYLKVSKVCHTEKGCFSDGFYKKLDGKNAMNPNTSTNISKFLTADGMSVFIYSYGSNSLDRGQGLKEAYGAIAVDINGFKKPNKFGEDTFSFIVTKEGIVPFGLQGSIIDETLEDSTVVYKNAFPNACNISDCFQKCEGCAAWVIYNENMDYLHCNGLDWNGTKSCKDLN